MQYKVQKRFVTILTCIMISVELCSCFKSDNDQKYVFFGDSHVHLWQTSFYFGSEDIDNLGVSSHRIAHLASKLNDLSQKINEVAIIEIGYNDITDLALSGQDNVEEILQNRFDNLIAKAFSKFNRVVILSVIPHTKDHHGDETMKLTKNINEYLFKKSTISEMEYIDVSSILLDQDGLMNLFFTTEGIHLNSGGYDLVSQKCYEIFN